MTSFEYDSISDSESAEKLGAIHQQCFNMSPETSGAYSGRVGLENLRIIRDQRLQVVWEFYKWDNGMAQSAFQWQELQPLALLQSIAAQVLL